MSRTTLVILLGSLCALSAAQATTYVRVEKDGTKTYSDRPMPGGQPVELKPAQSYSPPPPLPSTNSNLPGEQQALAQYDDFKYQSCSVTPENDASFTNPESVSIALVLNPSLRFNDVVTLTVDGQPAGGPNATNYTLAPAYRGTHSVGVTVKNTYGQVLCNYTSSFHVLRPGINSPANGRPRR